MNRLLLNKLQQECHLPSCQVSCCPLDNFIDNNDAILIFWVSLSHHTLTTFSPNNKKLLLPPQLLTSTINNTIQGSIATQQTKPKDNAMTAKTHETTISIKQRVPVKAIRIERDYSLGDGITRFQTEFPMELTGKVT